MIEIISKKEVIDASKKCCIYVINFKLTRSVKFYKKIPNSILDSVIGSFKKQNRKFISKENLFRGDTYTIVGKANCSPNDEFKEEIGIKIAKTRAYVQLDKLSQFYFTLLRKRMFDVIDELDNKIIQSEEMATKGIVSINKYL